MKTPYTVRLVCSILNACKDFEHRKDPHSVSSVYLSAAPWSAVPVYETLPGWKSSTEGITKFADLPQSAQQIVKIVERETGIPVSMVGTGPSRDAMVVR